VSAELSAGTISLLMSTRLHRWCDY